MRTALLFCGCLLTAAITAADEPGRVSFRHDVMATLSKAGCNLGTCHGNANGKGGFQLSLRGQYPQEDFLTLTHALDNRRVNPLDPGASLLLRKPTMQIAHEGGQRFEVGSVEYRILRDWIAAGMPEDDSSLPTLERLEVAPTERILFSPEDSVQITAEAVFSDGTRRDVTRLAVYEPAAPFVIAEPGGRLHADSFGETVVTVRYLDQQVPVRLAFRPARPDFQWTGPEPANVVDQAVFAKLEKLRIQPSRVCDDTVFLRRAYLDLLGMVPTADEARRFIADPSADKRSRLIDELLQRPEYAEFWALKWSDILRNEEKTLDRKGVETFHAWIRLSISQNKPLDVFVRELIAARGSTYQNPPANYWRAMREPLMRSESTAQLFLGVRLQCAKCHNHPFDRWTQDDYYGWGSLFTGVEYKILENNRRDRNDKYEFDGEQIVYLSDGKNLKNPDSGRLQPPTFLADGDTVDPKADRLEQLAQWLTSPDNQRFAQSQANRIWFHLMGRGVVEPIDDFRATNPPINEELLDALARELVDSGFDVRHVIHLIMNSRTYQLSAEPNESNVHDDRNFSHAMVRRLSAEQLLDSVSRALGVPVEFNGFPLGTRAAQVPGVQAVRSRDRRPSTGDKFLTLFGRPKRLQSCECERSDESTLAQTFQLVSGPLINELLTDRGHRLDDWADAEQSPEEIVDVMFWSALSREPSQAERAAAVESLTQAKDRRRSLEDLAWALLNSHEFLLRR